MCKTPWYAAVAIGMAMLLTVVAANSAPSPSNTTPQACDTFTLAKAQADLAAVDAKTMILSTPEHLKVFNETLQQFTQGKGRLKDGVTVVILAIIEGKGTLAGEFKDGCFVAGGQVPAMFVQEVLTRIAK